MLEKIKWLGHASFILEAKKRIYIDPWKLKTFEPADIILVSHSHFDHFSVGDIARLKRQATVIIAAADCARQIKGVVTTLLPGEKTAVGDIVIEGVAAYNINKSFHPRENNWLGFVINIDEQRIYYAGDTDATPEMEALQSIDIGLLPVGGTYTMDAQEAADSANIFKPNIAIPYHWGDIVGTRRDAEDFIALFKNGKGVLLEISR